MNRYFKFIDGDYLIAIGQDDFTGETITQEEYENISSIIDTKPNDTLTHYYMLRSDTLEYEMIERPEPLPEPLPEPTYTLDEAATILAQEVSA